MTTNNDVTQMASKWVYLPTGSGIYTVGFYDVHGEWRTDRDYTDRREAADRVAELNGEKQQVASAVQVELPSDLIQKIRDLVDYEEICSILKPQINRMLADRIVSQISTEWSIEVKQVFANQNARKHLREVLSKEFRTNA